MGSTVLLWLFVVNLGIVFGAGVYEHRVVVSRWLGRPERPGGRWDAATARLDDPGLRFWVFASTIPLTLLTLGNLGAAWQATGGLRGWWLAAALLALADRAVTFAYFIPTMVRLMRTEDSPGARARASRWSSLNHLRHALVLAAWLAALQSFALLSR